MRTKWSNLKTVALRYEDFKNETGGGPPFKGNILVCEKVLEVCADQTKHGITSQHRGESDPFGFDGPQSQDSQDSQALQSLAASSSISKSTSAAVSSKTSAASSSSKSAPTLSSKSAAPSSSKSAAPSSSKSAAPSSSKSAPTSSSKSAAAAASGKVVSSDSDPLLSCSSAIRHDVIQEEFLRVEKQKVVLMKEQLETDRAALQVNRETLAVQSHILEVLKSWQY
ncbi:uncharacterized protein [Amphiura filiformis]|uniref:uncharacterized protein n=1 Tax=Amphiura filiformis TaxID=82378 RepID=UPI003B22356E